ncbi:MAG TPA: response regulator, partial [Verrucomicrobiae bacterium]|nr:response regulator [Verrucomicrobiae bacterium]
AEKDAQKCFVLIADDSEEDSFFLERALRHSTLFELVGSVRNGEEVIAYFSGEGQYADRQLWPLPNLLLMDLKMPRRSGMEVLEWLKGQRFPNLKVVVLTGSSVAQDIEKVRSLGADAFFTKSLQHGKLIEMVKKLEEFVTGANGGAPPAQADG